MPSVLPAREEEIQAEKEQGEKSTRKTETTTKTTATKCTKQAQNNGEASPDGGADTPV